jgi:hypothetical protein
MVGIIEWVYGIIAKCVYVEGIVREDLDVWRFFLEFEGHSDDCQL